MSRRCDTIDDTASLRYCIKHYASYGLFATYCLRIAVVATEVYTFSSFKRAFLSSGDNQCNDPKLQKFLELVPYEDSEYFSFSETRFLLQLSRCCSPRSDAKLARDHRRATREIKRGKRILPSHAKALAKAIEYWKLRYDEKYEEWHQRFNEVNGARILRAELRELFGDEPTETHEDSSLCGFCGDW